MRRVTFIGKNGKQYTKYIETATNKQALRYANAIKCFMFVDAPSIMIEHVRKAA